MSNLVVRKKSQQKQFNEALRDHGATEPGRIEHKRQQLSATVAKIGNEVAKMIENQAKLRAEGKLTPDVDAYLGLSISNLSTSAAILNALGLVVDCLSYRYKVKIAKGPNKGRVGYTRSSVALNVDCMSEDLEAVKYLLQKHADIELPEPDENEDETDEEEIYFQDDEERLRV